MYDNVRGRICTKCMYDPRLKLIVATDVKKKYFLTDEDLKHLKPLLRPNPFNKTAPIKLYNLVEVDTISRAKMELLNTTLEERRKKAKERGNRMRSNRRRRENARERELVSAFTSAGISYPRHLNWFGRPYLCYNYIANSWRGFDKPRTIDEIVEYYVDEHVLDEHTALSAMQRDSRYMRELWDKHMREDGLNVNEYSKQEALELLRKCEEDKADVAVSTCRCGRKNFQELLVAEWEARNNYHQVETTSSRIRSQARSDPENIWSSLIPAGPLRQ